LILRTTVLIHYYATDQDIQLLREASLHKTINKHSRQWQQLINTRTIPQQNCCIRTLQRVHATQSSSLNI